MSFPDIERYLSPTFRRAQRLCQHGFGEGLHKSTVEWQLYKASPRANIKLSSKLRPISTLSLRVRIPRPDWQNCLKSSPKLQNDSVCTQIIEPHSNFIPEQLEQKIRALEWRDLQLWCIEFVALAALGTGLIALVAPQMSWSVSPLVRHQHNLPQLIVGLTILLPLLNVYLFRQRTVLLGMRRRLTLQLQIAEATSSWSLCPTQIEARPRWRLQDLSLWSKNGMLGINDNIPFNLVTVLQNMSLGVQSRISSKRPMPISTLIKRIRRRVPTPNRLGHKRD